MSALTTPKGPLPPRVYWFRRLILLSVVLVLVLGVGRLFSGSGDGASDDGVKATTTGAEIDPQATESTPAQAAEVAAEEGGSGQGKKQKEVQPTPEPTPEPPPLPTPTGPCLNEDVLVMPAVGAPRTDGKVDMTLVLRTKSTPACTWQISPQTAVVKISSGSDNYWFSSQCPSAIPTADLVLYQETDTTVPFVWSGKRSDENCSNLTDWAYPGFYHVSAAAFDGEPTQVQFERGPASITATKTAEPKQEKGKSKKKNSKETGMKATGKKATGKKTGTSEGGQSTPQQPTGPAPSGAVEPTPTP